MKGQLCTGDLLPAVSQGDTAPLLCCQIPSPELERATVGLGSRIQRFPSHLVFLCLHLLISRGEGDIIDAAADNGNRGDGCQIIPELSNRI